MKKIFVLLFVGASTLTVVTNYLNFSTGVDLLLSTSGDELLPSDDSKLSTMHWLQYRVNKTESESEFTGVSAFKKSSWPWPNCTNVTSDTWMTGETLRKTYIILKNFIKAEREVFCDDSLITLTTHGDYRYLDNLVPVVERWQGPVSISLYVPYDDLTPTLSRIAFMRECTTPLIKEWVSFHLFSETRYFLHTSDETVQIWQEWNNTNLTQLCETIPEFDDKSSTSRKEHKLYYPVNMARNVARQMARTRYIFASDVELYPSIDFIPKFFKMLSRYADFFNQRVVPYVFVLPIFEMEEGYDLPDTKEQLIDYLDTNVSVTFHKYVCLVCHKVPKYEEWVAGNATVSMSKNKTKPHEEGEMTVFHVAKRKAPFHNWEPIYVSTNDVPLYDERLSWEGLQDKMSQSYIMCLLDYDFMILDYAFLMHKPGMKKKARDVKKPSVPRRRQSRILYRVNRQIKRKYGSREGCCTTCW